MFPICFRALAKNCAAPLNDKDGAEAKKWKEGKAVRVVWSKFDFSTTVRKVSKNKCLLFLLRLLVKGESAIERTWHELREQCLFLITMNL